MTLHYGKSSDGADIINVLPHGHKVFNLHRDLPVAAMTCGLGNLGSASIAHLAKDLRIALMGDGAYGDRLDPDKYSIAEVASKARKFLFDRFTSLTEKPNAEMSFYVGGYSSDAEAPEHWLTKIDAQGSSPDPVCLSKKCQQRSGGEELLWSSPVDQA